MKLSNDRHPVSQSQISKVYPIAGDPTNGFFKVVAEPVDPVTD